MPSKIRAYLDVIADEGCRLVSAHRGRKHFKLRVEADGHEFTMVAAGTPGDYRAITNFRGDLRRIRRAFNTDGVDSIGQHALVSAASTEEN